MNGTGDSTRAIVEALGREFDSLWEQTAGVVEDPAGPPPGWRPPGGSALNPAAVLVTHLCGAHRFWIGELLGGRPSGRVRSSEFAETTTQVSRQSLAELVAGTRSLVTGTLAGLRDRDLSGPVEPPPGGFSAAASSHPLIGAAVAGPLSPRAGRGVTRAYCVLHALAHHAHHNGQLLQLRRLWSEAGRR